MRRCSPHLPAPGPTKSPGFCFSGYSAWLGHMVFTSNKICPTTPPCQGDSLPLQGHPGNVRGDMSSLPKKQPFLLLY